MYDLSAVKDIANGDKEFLEMLISTFISEVPPDANGMSEAIENGNAALAFQFSHKLKPNLQSFGVDLDDQLMVIEDWSNDKADTAQAQHASDKIGMIIHRVVLELKKEYDLK